MTRTFKCPVCNGDLGCGHEMHDATRERGTSAQELVRARRLAARAPEWVQWAWRARIARLEKEVGNE